MSDVQSSNYAARDVDVIAVELRAMTVPELQQRYEEEFREPIRSHSREHLVRRILWRVQANREGDLSERARRRAIEIADDADIRLGPPRRRPQQMTETVTLDRGGTLSPGVILRRDYRGRTLVVRVVREGFEFDGEIFPSLSAVANRITGSHWSGARFFGLTKGRSS
ncbi:MAG: DUF2924 domain-containing protein [Phycisphaerae bacterium]|nr:DUF2924 domain-containing protein [Phycisphaerae bacterium]